MYDSNPLGNPNGLHGLADTNERPSSAVRGMSRGLSVFLSREKGRRAGSVGNRSLPSIEHRERRSWGSGEKNEA
jgi:hypothetical protein